MLLALPGALAAESWTSTATSGAPVGRFNHCAVWTGSRMIVWGGDSGNRTTLGSGGVYNPESRTWTATAFGNAPSAREVASAVWTGEKMIVWGGFQATGNITATVFNDGAIYDPETNTWAPVATSGAPSARYAHTAVWTGSRMIVWGGFAKEVSPNPVNFGAVNTGASYDPVLNIWKPLSTLNAPSPRGSQSAVWTGSRMIVWGGDDGRETDIGGGGIYDPETDTWVALPVSGEPSGRDEHTAVWTGTSMVVWGGYAGTVVTNTGADFDPSKDSWKPTSAAGSPSARELHVALWTGERMLIWGGWTGTSNVNTGGLYDPVADTWSPVSTVGAPSGREQASAVWTGTRMIVWGGYDGHADVNTGGIYLPPSTPCSHGIQRGCFSGIPGHPVARVGHVPAHP